MAKLKVELSFEKFSLKIDADKPDDIGLASDQIARQFGAVLTPAARIVDAREPEARVPSAPADSEPKPKKRRPSPKRSRPGSSKQDQGAETPSWRHNPEKWGNPLQSWTTLQKSIWLLYVAQEDGVAKELTGPAIARAFNLMFRQAKEVHPPNVTRDLGKEKSTIDSKVGEDTSQTPSAWYLTSTGIEFAKGLVAEARGVAEPS